MLALILAKLGKNIKNKDQRPKIRIAINNVSCEALIDTGSEVSAVSWDWYRRNLPTVRLAPALGQVLTAAAAPVQIKGKLQAQIKIGNELFSFPLLVIKGLTKEALLGIDVLLEKQLQVNVIKGTLEKHHPVTVTKQTTICPGHYQWVPCSTVSALSLKDIMVENQVSEQPEVYCTNQRGKC